MSQIRQLFSNVPMANRIDGLKAIARDSGLKLHDLKDNDYLLFVNRARTKVALLVGPEREDGYQVMVYAHVPGGRALDPRVLAEIPCTFDGRRINVPEAERLALEKALQRQGKTISVAF